MTYLAEVGVDHGWNWPDTLITLGLVTAVIALITFIVYIVVTKGGTD